MTIKAASSQDMRELADLETPLSNGWHINGKRMAEDEEYFLLDNKGHGIAQFVSREIAEQFFAIVREGKSETSQLEQAGAGGFK